MAVDVELSGRNVQSGGAAAHQGNAVLRMKSGRAQRNPFFWRASGHEVLRQVRAVVRCIRLLIDDRQRSVEAAPAQHFRRRRPRRSGTDNDDVLHAVRARRGRGIGRRERIALELPGHHDLAGALLDVPAGDR